jgi:hypothetical protein
MTMMYLHMGYVDRHSMKWNYSAHVDVFGDISMHYNRDISIDMKTIHGIQTNSAYPQLSWILHFLWNLLTAHIVILLSHPICLVVILIYIMFAASCYIVCQPAFSGMFKNISLLKAGAPDVLPEVVASVICMACIASARA